jgi:hypothetical protein
VAERVLGASGIPLNPINLFIAIFRVLEVCLNSNFNVFVFQTERKNIVWENVRIFRFVSLSYSNVGQP